MNFSSRVLAVSFVCASFIAPAVAESLTEDPVYDRQCAKCHGKTAEGRHFGGPSLAKSTMTLDEVKAIIANGKGHMPKFAGRLTQEQIDALAAEIKDLSKAPSPK